MQDSIELRYAVAIPSSGVRAINIVAALQFWNQRFGIKGFRI